MTTEDVKAAERRILSFAHFLSPGRTEADAVSAAVERRWLDHGGAPTQDGFALARALGDQRRTRTAFRQIV